MSMSSPTPKPVVTLTRADFLAFPIWEYCDENSTPGQDETWVRPVDTQTVPRQSYAIVAAEFRAACGGVYEGSIAVSWLQEPAEFFNGMILHEEDRFLIPDPELVFFDRALAQLMEGLGLTENQLFPLSFTLKVPFAGESKCRSGLLDGRKANGNEPEPLDKGQMTFW